MVNWGREVIMKYKFILFLTSAVMILAGFSVQVDAQTKRFRIAVIPKDRGNFWRVIRQGALNAANDAYKAEKCKVELVWVDPKLSIYSVASQTKAINKLIRERIDAIVLAPIDAREMRRPVKNAVKAGIKVVIIDSALRTPDVVSFIATDNYEAGKLCAKTMGKLMDDKGNVLLVCYLRGSASTSARENGFRAGMREYAPKVRVLSAPPPTPGSAKQLYSVCRNMLGRYGYVNAVFCPNEATTVAMLKALKSLGRGQKMKFVGFDYSRVLEQGLKDGDLDAFALQDPYRMGYLGVKYAVMSLLKKPVKSRVDTGVVIATRQNMNDPLIKKRLHPPMWSKKKPVRTGSK